MKIGVLTHTPSAYSHKRFSEVAKAKSHQIRFIPMSHCYLSISSAAPTIFYRDNEIFEDLDAIIPRFNKAHNFYGSSVLRQFEMMGIFTLNSSVAINWSRDKLRSFQLLASKHLPLPITGFADSPEESEKLIDVVGGAPLIIRLLAAHEGRGTIFAETQQEAISVINAFKQLKTNILVQEFIKEAEGSDIRCVVVGNEVITAIERSHSSNVIKDNGFRARRYTALLTKPIEITKAEKKIALQAAKAMKLNFATIDLIRSNRGPLVSDVDCSPNIERLEKSAEVDIAGAIIDFLVENSKTND